MNRLCYQLNFQSSIGGGEIYTRFLTRTLQRLGWRTILLVSRQASFWPQFMPGVECRAVGNEEELLAALSGEPSLVLSHSIVSSSAAPLIAARHRLAGIIHMPLYGREPRGLPAYHRVFAVSEHVRASALARGLVNVHAQPLYGVADLDPRESTGASTLRAASAYEWDRRKLRDRLLGWAEQRMPQLAPPKIFARRDGITLGIVSRLTPIKQFPEMFTLLAPLLAKRPVQLEIFGSGGYASVADLKHALAPMRERTRFWGHQPDVLPVYRQLDYVMSGLPEKEALGLNLIEAQAAGTPVLAVNAPPFNETVADGLGGYLFEDPRKDGGAGFAHLMDRLIAGAPRPDPRRTAHLERFSAEAFQSRLESALAAAMDAGPA